MCSKVAADVGLEKRGGKRETRETERLAWVRCWRGGKKMRKTRKCCQTREQNIVYSIDLIYSTGRPAAAAEA